MENTQIMTMHSSNDIGRDSTSTRRKVEVPVWEKIAWTIEEAAAMSGIGQNKISQLLANPRCKFVLHVGRKKLVKKKEFQEFIDNNIQV